jgi:hypothetical protein
VRKKKQGDVTIERNKERRKGKKEWVFDTLFLTYPIPLEKS